MRKTAAALLFVAMAVLAAVEASASADKSQTVTGTITRVQASARTIVVALSEGGEARFVWNDDTKISGVLTPGAKVTVRYSAGPDGGQLALQITVARS